MGKKNKKQAPRKVRGSSPAPQKQLTENRRRKNSHEGTQGHNSTSVSVDTCSPPSVCTFTPQRRKHTRYTQSRDSPAKNRNLAYPAKVPSKNHGWLSGICDTDGTFRTRRSVLVVNKSGTLTNSVCASQKLRWV